MSVPASPAQPRIRTLLPCDLVASTQLVERVGDVAVADLLGELNGR